MPGDDFSSLFDSLPIGAYRSTPEGRQLRANPALVRMNGYAAEPELLAAADDLDHGWYVVPGRRAEFQRLMERDGFVSDFVSEIHRHKTRERIWIREHAHVVTDAATGERFYEGTIEEITAQRQAQLALQVSERRFRAFTEKAQVITLLCDREFRVRYISPTIESILGIAPDVVLGRTPLELVHPNERAAVQKELESVLTHTNTGVESIVRAAHRDGGWRFLAAIANNCLDDEAVGGVIFHLRDVTDSHLAQEKLRALTRLDPLTGLHNRAAFERTLRRVIGAAESHAAVHFIDLDRFKLINDSLGHAAGDHVLRVIAERLGQAVPVGCFVARMGGDEFAVLEPLASGGHEAAKATARALLRALAEPIEVDDIRFQISGSIGISVFPEHGQTFEALLRHADLAMFRAKSEQRDAYRVFEPTFATAADTRLTLMAELRSAIALQQFEVFYQPQVSLETGALRGAEALLRWRHPQRGVLEPAAFIGDAEELGLIGRIGMQAAAAALDQFSRWRAQYRQPLTLALNLSPFQLRDPGFLDEMLALLARFPDLTGHIEMEITEAALVHATDGAPQKLRALADAGVRIVLDDLGVAYSALSHLQQFHVHGVKLDRGFVAGLPHSLVDGAIVRALIALAANLDLRVVAEGVEREDQRHFLLGSGCRVGQGYLFARPLSASAMEEMLAAQQGDAAAGGTTDQAIVATSTLP